MENLKIYDTIVNNPKTEIYINNDEKLRDLYLRKLAIGEIQGPPTGKPSIDKEWLRFYSEEAIMSDMPEMTMYQYILHLHGSNENKALYYFKNQLNRSELVDKIEQCKKSFVQNGIKKGDIVTICMPNTIEATVAIYALNRIGAAASIIHPLSAEKEIQHFLNEVESKLVITIDSSYEKINRIVNQTSIQTIITVSPKNSMPPVTKLLYPLVKKEIKISKDKKVKNWNKFMNDSNLTKYEMIEDAPYEKGRVAVILHTGGTTGNPKGVELTDDNFNCMVEQFKQNTNDFAVNDRLLAIMPVFHGFGLCSSIHLPLSLGVEVNLIPKLEKKNISKIFKEYKPNHVIGVPTLYEAILSDMKMNDVDLSYLKHIVSGGDVVKDSLETRINDFLKKHNSNIKLSKGYGLSEAVAGVTFAHNDYNVSKSVGIPMVATNFKIISAKTGEELPNEAIGEICIKGSTVMKRYYKNEFETSKCMSKDGWLNTGDLGYFKEGILYFQQRKGNMIISSGVNVYPIVIEQLIEQHEAIASCAVIGVKDAYKGEIPKAYIVLNEGYEWNQELQEEIKQLCKVNLNRYSIPAKYEVRESLPQTLLGKITHKALYEDANKILSFTKTIN